MKIRNKKAYRLTRRHRRVRNRIFGTTEQPRMCVYKSAKHIYAQIVDDTEGRTLAAASSLKVGPLSVEKPEDEKTDEKQDKKGKKGSKKGKPVHVGGKKTAVAREVGKVIAEAAKQKGITKVCFDRGGFQYHGRIAALADEARKNGLEF
ncbi:MAG: 50S ribosomal protein L18 [Candidatus Latescibacterota bacterium]|nr:MAG: 50S ribosomal protein L18 [Candidatus Latescibacterota bacterium]